MNKKLAVYLELLKIHFQRLDMLSESELVRGCKEYNSKAQRELYERFYRKMSVVCYCYSGSRDDAKDLLHEGFIKVFAKISEFKEEGSLEGWIRRIMVNTTINFVKQKKRFLFQAVNDLPEEEDLSAESHEEEVLDMDFTQEELGQAIDKLKEDYRLIFTLHCFDKYSHKEISEMLGILEDTSRSRLRRARAILRKELLLKRKIRPGFF